MRTAQGAKRGLARLPAPFRQSGRFLFQLLFPGECEICGVELTEVSRIPVCPACLSQPYSQPAEFACISCGTPFLNNFPLRPDGRCAICRAGAAGFEGAYSFGPYDEPLSQLIHLFKYRRIRTLAGPLGELLHRAMPQDEQFDAIVPVPLHWRKQWKRGFNQSLLLAEELSRHTGLPVVKGLRRQRFTAAQAGLTNSQRRHNVASAFAARNAQQVAGKKILLIDDVMTTGSTLSAAANVLRRAGAARVTVLTLARADRRAPSPLSSRIPPNQLAVSGAS